MGNNISELRTSQTLLDSLQKAASRKMSASDIFEQRVSFVYGSMDSSSSVTRQHVKQVIASQEGIEVE